MNSKTVLITGAASGIGRATALDFGKAGATVVVSDIQVEAGAETVSMVESAGGKAVFIQADVSDYQQVKELIAGAIAVSGKLDIAINNAGIGGEFTSLAEYKHAEWDRIIAINQTGVFYCMQEELKQMQQQRSGVIINIASMAGLKGLYNAPAYVASKHAVIGMTKTAAIENSRYNIRINAVCPAFTESALLDKMLELDPSYEKKLRISNPMRRFGKAEEISAAILWLASEKASFVTGLAMPVDGGMMA